MQDHFNRLADFLDSQVSGGRQYTCWFSAESSDFVRFNRGLIRQPGHVKQSMLSLELIDGMRHANSTVTLSGDPASDCELLERTLTSLHGQLPDLPDDPHLLISTECQSTQQRSASQLPPASEMVNDILRVARGHDMVGILAAGPVVRGFANSHGQRNWHETSSFNLDWSIYQSGDKAVKTAYAGQDWDQTLLHAKFQASLEQLVLLGRAPVRIAPGAYRAYLAPAALNEIIGMLNWDGVSEKSLRTRQSSLRRMRDEGVRLNPAISLCENTAEGLAPGFQSAGFIKPSRVCLIDRGRLAGSLVSPRTAREYGIETNGAGAGEAMASIDLAAGDLPVRDTLAALGTGILVSNLWYLNYSDRASCRMTGMTRFASFWVEDGAIVAPLEVMRFDESIYRLLGDKLLGLTRERELLIDNDSYGARGTSSARMPGALVKDFTFVL
ncbi:MAG: TldE/PmbA family protein [Herminiimonas sp.]|nr:TldE/PmbA family protein [Herminiimonas sp.]